MSYDQTHLDAIDLALSNLQSGQTIQEVETNGKRVRYTTANLDQLLRYRSQVAAVVSGSGSGGMFNKVTFNDPT
jgi:hypothetical protein